MNIRSLMRHTVLTSALCALLGVPTLAQATLFLVGDGYKNGSESMTLTAPPPPLAEDPVDAGGFFGRIGTTNPPTTPFLFWCAELSQTFSFGTVYSDYTMVPLANTLLSQLFTEVGGSAGATGGANIGNDDGTDLSAAFQVAIWEILFETDPAPYNVSTGKFTATGDADVVNKANALLAGLSKFAPTDQLMLLHSADNQDFITERTPIGFLVPEPSPLPLLGIGILAVMIAMRRRTQRASR